MALNHDYKKLTSVRGKIDVSGMCHASCPFIGSKRDQSTPMGFPHQENLCHRHGEGIEKQLQYQRLFCLSAEYESCEIYQQPAKPPSPEAAAGPQRLNMRFAFPAALILLLMFAIIAAPIVMQNAGDDGRPRFMPDLAPVHALFQEPANRDEETSTPSEPGPAADMESRQEGSEAGLQPSETEPDTLRTGSGGFRTIPYQSTK